MRDYQLSFGNPAWDNAPSLGGGSGLRFPDQAANKAPRFGFFGGPDAFDLGRPFNPAMASGTGSVPERAQAPNDPGAGLMQALAGMAGNVLANLGAQPEPVATAQPVAFWGQEQRSSGLDGQTLLLMGAAGALLYFMVK